jgi:hypothetical protein
MTVYADGGPCVEMCLEVSRDSAGLEAKGVSAKVDCWVNVLCGRLDIGHVECVGEGLRGSTWC